MCNAQVVGRVVETPIPRRLSRGTCSPNVQCVAPARGRGRHELTRAQGGLNAIHAQAMNVLCHACPGTKKSGLACALWGAPSDASWLAQRRSMSGQSSPLVRWSAAAPFRHGPHARPHGPLIGFASPCAPGSSRYSRNRWDQSRFTSPSCNATRQQRPSYRLQNTGTRRVVMDFL